MRGFGFIAIAVLLGGCSRSIPLDIPITLDVQSVLVALGEPPSLKLEAANRDGGDAITVPDGASLSILLYETTLEGLQFEVGSIPTRVTGRRLPNPSAIHVFDGSDWRQLPELPQALNVFVDVIDPVRCAKSGGCFLEGDDRSFCTIPCPDGDPPTEPLPPIPPSLTSTLAHSCPPGWSLGDFAVRVCIPPERARPTTCANGMRATYEGLCVPIDVCESSTYRSILAGRFDSILYVDVDALPGGDGTEGSPFSTIIEALSAVTPGSQNAILLSRGDHAIPSGRTTVRDDVAFVGTCVLETRLVGSDASRFDFYSGRVEFEHLTVDRVELNADGGFLAVDSVEIIEDAVSKVTVISEGAFSNVRISSDDGEFGLLVFGVAQGDRIHFEGGRNSLAVTGGGAARFDDAVFLNGDHAHARGFEVLAGGNITIDRARFDISYIGGEAVDGTMNLSNVDVFSTSTATCGFAFHGHRSSIRMNGVVLDSLSCGLGFLASTAEIEHVHATTKTAEGPGVQVADGQMRLRGYYESGYPFAAISASAAFEIEDFVCERSARGLSVAQHSSLVARRGQIFGSRAPLIADGGTLEAFDLEMETPNIAIRAYLGGHIRLERARVRHAVELVNASNPCTEIVVRDVVSEHAPDSMPTYRSFGVTSGAHGIIERGAFTGGTSSFATFDRAYCGDEERLHTLSDVRLVTEGTGFEMLQARSKVTRLYVEAGAATLALTHADFELEDGFLKTSGARSMLTAKDNVVALSRVVVSGSEYSGIDWTTTTPSLREEILELRHVHFESMPIGLELSTERLESDLGKLIERVSFEGVETPIALP